MIQSLRKDIQRLHNVIWVILACFIIGIISGNFTGKQQRSAYSPIGTIEPQKLPLYTYEFIYQVRTIENMRRMIWNMLMQGKLNFEMLSYLGDFQKPVPQVALKNLVEQKMVAYAASSINLTLDPQYFAQRLIQQLGHDPQFADSLLTENGTIKESAYQEFLEKSYALSIPAFEEIKADDMRREQLKQSVNSAGYIPSWIVREKFATANTKKEFTILPITYHQFLQKIAAESVNEHALQTYYQEHKETYEEPEKRAATYWVFNPAHQATTAEIDDDALETFYEKHKETKFKHDTGNGYKPLEAVRSEIITTLRINSVTRALESALAEALHASKNDPEALSALAARYKVTPQKLALSPKKEAENSKGLAAELIKHLFEKQRATNRNNGEFTHDGTRVLFQETERIAASVPPLAQIQTQVMSDYQTEQARKECKTFTRESKRALLAGTSTLSGVAQSLNATIITTPAVTNSDTFSRAPGAPRLYEKAFLLTHTDGQVLSYKTDDGYLLVTLNSQTQPNPNEYAERESTIRQDLDREEKGRYYTTFVASLTRNATLKTNTQYEELQRAFSAAQ